MENGDGSIMVENKIVEERVANEKEDESVVGGADKTKDVEDEVFEEAIGTEEPLQELTEKSGLGNGNIEAGEIGNGEAIGDSGLEAVQENSDVEPEAENFEEAIGVPSEVGHPGDVIPSEVGTQEDVLPNEVEPKEDVAVLSDDQKVEEFSGGESVGVGVVSDKIDEGGTDMGVGTDELNGGKERHEISGTGETEVPRDEDEGNVKSDAVIEKPVNGAEGTLEDEKGESLEGDKMGDDVKMESKLEVLPQEVKGEELRVDALATDCQDEKVGKSVDTSAGMNVELQDDEVESLNGESTNFDTEDLEKKRLEVKDSVDDGDEGEKANKTLATMALEDNRIEEVKDSSDAQDLKSNGKVDELKDTLSELSTSVEGTVTPEFRNSSSSEKFRDERNEKIDASKTDLSKEIDDQMVDKIQVIKSVAEDSEKKAERNQEDNPSTQVTLDRELQQASGSSSPVKAEESAKKSDTDHELKPNTPVAREREILPEPLSSSSVKSTNSKSTNSATPPSRPAGLGRAAPLLEPAPRVVQQPRANGAVSQTQVQAQQVEDAANGEAEESDETREKLQLIRVKFLRLAHRLGQTPHNVVVAQVLYRLGLAEQLRGRNGGRVGAFSFDRASAMAEQLEAAGTEPLDFSCTIMVLGKSGVGKSATINSIFDEVKFGTDAFQTGTKKVQDVVGTVHGIKVRVIDTPGLLSSWSDQRQNEKILHSVKNFIKKTPPDIVLYLDRLDMQTRDFGDMPLLRTISEIFGPSIWFNAIVVLTHAASAPPDGPNGTASSYDMFVTQRSHVVQQAIRQAAGDMRLMNPVSLVENHSACRTNRAGQRVLPNGQVWKPHLLLLSFASKILAEANTLLKLQDTSPGKPFATRTRTPPLPFLLSSLLQSRPEVKLPEEQYGDDSLDDDLDESSDSEDESEYDELPPFKRLTKAQIAKLSRAQKKAYFDELEYREKLFMKKQLKEEKKQRKMMKKMAAAAKDLPSEFGENAEEESSGASSVPVPMPDLALPASFDSDNPTHRYRYLDSSNPWLVRPVLDTHGWDHDVGYEGINAERLFVAKDKIPISFSGQITKDKKDANVQMELTSSLKHGEGKATSLGFDMQTVGKDLAYTLRSETRFINFRKNKATAGISVTLLGDALSAGVKVEDKLIANKRFQVVMTGGAMTGRGDLAYGGSLEAQLRDKDYPLGRSLSTLGLSVMDWHGDLAIGCNIQSQVPVGRSTNFIARANLNNRGAGQVSIRINSSEQLQLALISLLPLLKKLLNHPQQMQYG
ncbi:hypothetical protein PTKIN_Ptkin10aG0158700 [Pterospermum kingtungense]